MSEVEWINESIDLNEILMDIDEFVRYPENNKKKKKLRKKISELKQLDYDNEEIRLAMRIAKNLLRKNEVTKKENDESKERMMKMSVDPSSPEINEKVEEAIKNIDKNIDKVMGFDVYNFKPDRDNETKLYLEKTFKLSYKSMDFFIKDFVYGVSGLSELDKYSFDNKKFTMMELNRGPF